MNRNLKSLNELPILLDAQDIKEITRLSRAGAYQLLNSDSFPIIRIGKRILVPRDTFVAWLTKFNEGRE